MKSFYTLLITASMMLCTFVARAENTGVNIDGKNIQITEMTSHGEERVLHSKEFPKGIYVVANSSPGSGDRFPNAEAVIAERLKLQGFKVVDKMDDASVAIKLTIAGSISIPSADKRASYSMLPSANQVAVNGGAAIGAAISTGVPGLVGFLVGGLYQSDSKGIMFVEVVNDPVVTHGLFGGTGIGPAAKNGMFVDSLYVYYRLEKNNEAQDDTVLKMLADQWIKRYLVLDNAPAVAASAVTASATLEETK